VSFLLTESNRRAWPALTLLAVTAAAGIVGCGSDPKPDKPLGEQQIVALTRASVVAISGKQGDATVGGTGTIIDAKQGLVLTNSHVISGVTSIEAKLNDQTTLPARVLAKSPCDDVALLKLVGAPVGLKALPPWTSKSLKPGDHVTALGYPANFQEAARATLQNTDGTISNATLRNTSIDHSLPRYAELI
jgi:S1-C subfamily serine protease